MALPLSVVAMFAVTQQGPVPPIPQFQDPRIPMPNPWVQPGYRNIVWIQSPNFNARPAGAVVDSIILHSTVINTLELTTRAFLREASQVSTHFTIDRDGSIVQHVSTFDRAWHAGPSVDANGRQNLNHYSIGIELVNLNDGKDPYPEPQLRALEGIIYSMTKRFPITQLLSHEFVAVPSGRKSDPANFPWERLKRFQIPLFYGKNPNTPKD